MLAGNYNFHKTTLCKREMFSDAKQQVLLLLFLLSQVFLYVLVMYLSLFLYLSQPDDFAFVDLRLL